MPDARSVKKIVLDCGADLVGIAPVERVKNFPFFFESA